MTSTPVAEHPEYGSGNHTTGPNMHSPCLDLMYIFYLVTNVIIIILGVAGNGLVIWIAGFKVKKSVNTTWYLSLAVSDFLFCSFLPFSVIYTVEDNWIFGRFMCKFTSFIMSLNLYSSIFLLVVISVDRCVVVMFPVWAQNQRTARKASVIVMLAWIISGALSAPSIIFSEVEGEICSLVNDEAYTAEKMFDFIIGFVIPFLIIVICYVVIMRKLKTNQMTRSKKPFKIMTMLIATFFICWLPYHTVSLMEFSHEKYVSFLCNGQLIGFTLASANSCLNPFLYACMGKDFKKQCYPVLSKIENAIKGDEETD